MEQAILEKNSLTFNPETHEYRIRGFKPPSVTEVLSLLQDYHWSNEEAKHRGSNIHLACEFFDRNRLNFETLDPEYRIYLDAWIVFQRDFNLLDKQPVIEEPLYSEKYRYAGRPDRIYLEENLLIDIKTGASQKVVNLQLEAYRQLVYENYGARPRMIAIGLTPKGVYKYRSYKPSKSNFNIFLSALTVYNYKNF